MPATVSINARVDSKTKAQVGKILRDLGMNTSQAISVFFKQIIYANGIPFDIKLPNKATVTAVEQVTTGKGLVTFDSVDELLEDLKT